MDPRGGGGRQASGVEAAPSDSRAPMTKTERETGRARRPNLNLQSRAARVDVDVKLELDVRVRVKAARVAAKRRPANELIN